MDGDCVSAFAVFQARQGGAHRIQVSSKKKSKAEKDRRSSDVAKVLNPKSRKRLNCQVEDKKLRRKSAPSHGSKDASAKMSSSTDSENGSKGGTTMTVKASQRACSTNGTRHGKVTKGGPKQQRRPCDTLQKISRKSDAIAKNFSSSRKQAWALSDEEEEQLLDGDDVPLVEEAIREMHDSSGWGDVVEADAPAVNGDNFLSTVLNANDRVLTSSGEFHKKVDSKKKRGRMTKGQQEDNGVDVDEEGEEGEFLRRLKAKFAATPARAFEDGTEDFSASKKSKKSDKKRRSGPSNAPAAEDPGSVELGKECLASIISPVTVEKFFGEFWEKRPLHIRRGEPDHYARSLHGGPIFSTKTFDRLLRDPPDQQLPVLFGKNLDVTSYSPEEGRQTHNPPEGGRAFAPVVWDYYNNGCSLRLLNPQTFHRPVWRLCALLQELFGCMVGANMYLTPPGTQGFAPHYDDVEVFVLQLEGRKHWRAYDPPPRSQLARHSSQDFLPQEMEAMGAPCLDVVLEAGDLLYLPRGTIHQGDCLETDHHSLHLTVSCYQLNSYGDLLQKLLPAAVAVAMEEDVEFRRGLPVDFLRNLGVVHNDKNSACRRKVMDTVERLMGKLFSYAPVDAAADQLGKNFAHDSLPPCLDPSETSRCVEDGGERWSPAKSRVVNMVEIDPEDEVRLIRAHSVRVVTEDDNAVRLYYNVENSREYRQVGAEFLEIDADTAPAVEALIHAYPEYMMVEKLPIEALDLKMKFVQDLWERKLLLTKKPLEAHYDD